MSDPGANPPQPQVNPQIIDAVDKATTYAFGLQALPAPGAPGDKGEGDPGYRPGDDETQADGDGGGSGGLNPRPVPMPVPGASASPSRLSAGQAMAYDKAAQAAAIAFQDAADYQRNVLAVSNAAQGKALAMMFIDQANRLNYAEIFAVALVGSIMAPIVAGMAADALTKPLSNFPKI